MTTPESATPSLRWLLRARKGGVDELFGPAPTRRQVIRAWWSNRRRAR